MHNQYHSVLTEYSTRSLCWASIRSRTHFAYAESNDKLSELEESVLGTKTMPNVSIPYEIDSSFQGLDGFERVSKSLEEGRPYALAIVDVRMPPGWDGIKTIHKIREIDPCLHLLRLLRPFVAGDS